MYYTVYNGDAIWLAPYCYHSFFGGAVNGVWYNWILPGKIFMQTKQRPRYIVNEIKESF
jgi:hypothetical protein